LRARATASLAAIGLSQPEHKKGMWWLDGFRVG
jgi:hypothetical protein